MATSNLHAEDGHHDPTMAEMGKDNVQFKHLDEMEEATTLSAAEQKKTMYSPPLAC
jgi:hypothetical protein